MCVIVVYILRFSKVIVTNFTPITDVKSPHYLATTGHGRGRDSGVPAIHAGPNYGCKKPRYLAITRHGAGDGIRTRDICLGKAALYH